MTSTIQTLITIIVILQLQLTSPVGKGKTNLDHAFQS